MTGSSLAPRPTWDTTISSKACRYLPLNTTLDESNNIIACAYLGNSLLAVGSEAGLQIIHLSTGATPARMNIGAVRGTAWNSRENTLITCGDADLLKWPVAIQSAATAESSEHTVLLVGPPVPLRRIDPEQNGAGSVVISDDGHTIAVSHRRRHVGLIDALSGMLRHEISTTVNAVRLIAGKNPGEISYAGQGPRAVIRRVTPSGVTPSELESRETRPSDCITIGSAERSGLRPVAWMTADGRIAISPSNTGGANRLIEMPDAAQPKEICVSPLSTHLAVASGDHRVHVVDVKTQETMLLLQHDIVSGTVLRLMWVPERDLLVVTTQAS